MLLTPTTTQNEGEHGIEYCQLKAELEEDARILKFEKAARLRDQIKGIIKAVYPEPHDLFSCSNQLKDTYAIVKENWRTIQTRAYQFAVQIPIPIKASFV